MKHLIIIENYIIPLIGNINFKSFKNEDILTFYKNDKINVLSESVKNNIFIIINASIKYGIEKNTKKTLLSKK